VNVLTNPKVVLLGDFVDGRVNVVEVAKFCVFISGKRLAFEKDQKG